MPNSSWLTAASPAFRLMIATSWLAPESWQSKQDEAIREAVDAGPDWDEYLRLVDRHRTPALSWAALQRTAGLDIPSEVKQQLRKRSDACRMQALQHSVLLSEVLKAFERESIPVMVLKGALLSLDLYGDLGLRQSHDLDMAVPQGDIGRAKACLETLGWRPDPANWFPMTPRQEGKFWRMEHHLTFFHSQRGCMLELHWRNHYDAAGQTASMWARSIPIQWQGCPHRAMHPVDLVLYLCIHGGAHRWTRAKWLGDLARLHTAGRVDWESALTQARRSGQHKALSATIKLLELVHGLARPIVAGHPYGEVPSVLVDGPLRELKVAEDPGMRRGVRLLKDTLRQNRYERVLLPRRSWRETLSRLAYRLDDYRVLPLPDRLFWAYVPLRPFLWAWRAGFDEG